MLITRGGHFVAREVAMTNKSKAGIKAEQHELTPFSFDVRRQNPVRPTR